jgi:hypothetical protein
MVATDSLRNVNAPPTFAVMFLKSGGDALAIFGSFGACYLENRPVMS